MTITLTIRTAPWRAHVARLANAVDGLVPVVKGNGYGFGRVALAELASDFCDTVAVGTIHELDGLPGGLHPMVLTPTLQPPTTTVPILTVGNQNHIDALAGWGGRVVVKLESSMHRYGASAELVDEARRSGLDVIGVSIHPPLAGTANGVTPLADGRSPFHFERRRLDLHEPPHMHTSMAFIADGGSVPDIGSRVDVQRPLTMTTVDTYEWI